MSINPFANFYIFSLTVFYHYNRCFPCNRLYSGINQTNTTSHSVKEQLLRTQSTNKRTLDKTTRIRRVIVFRKMRQRSAFETIWNAFPFNRLLSQTRCHLRNVDITAFRTRIYHRNKSIILTQAFQTDTTSITNRLVENIGYLIFKLNIICFAGLVIKNADM